MPAGRALGLGLVAWSPLGFGMLTGKYGREKIADFGPAGSLPNKGGGSASGSDGRLNGDTPYGGMLFTEQNFVIVDELRAVAQEVGRPMVQVALAWVAGRPGVSSVLMGEQVRENAASLDIDLSPDQKGRLDAAGAPPQLNPYFIFDMPRDNIFGGCRVDSFQSS